MLDPSKKNCANFNHRRSNAPVRFCPGCGGTVNDKVTLKQCSDEVHNKMRREQNEFCVDCGKQLRH